jgi:hypothetical protein
MTDYTPDSLRAKADDFDAEGRGIAADILRAHADAWEAQMDYATECNSEIASAHWQMCKDNAALRDALQRIDDWSEAYPLDVFPEPDFKRAAKLLKAGGMTLDAISASNMRRVVTGVGEIARKALAPQQEKTP